MPKVEWEAQDRQERIWHSKIGGAIEGTTITIQVVVHRLIGLEGWFVSCRGAEYDDHALKSQNIEDAKREAWEMVAFRLNRFGKIYQDIAKRIRA